jgi:hypothetical protein
MANKSHLDSLTKGSSNLVEHSTRHLKVKHSSPTTGAEGKITNKVNLIVWLMAVAQL